MEPLNTQRGQAFLEVAFMIPLTVLLALGAIEVANVVDTHLVISHISREGASMTHHGLSAHAPGHDNDVLDTLVTKNETVIDLSEASRWRIFYSRIGPAGDPINPNNCTDNGAPYVVLEQNDRGGLGVSSQVGAQCSPAALPNIDSVAPGLNLHAVEVYYQYTPLTGVGSLGVNLGSDVFYERSIF